MIAHYILEGFPPARKKSKSLRWHLKKDCAAHLLVHLGRQAELR
jgi:hypothetical protein